MHVAMTTYNSYDDDVVLLRFTQLRVSGIQFICYNDT